MSLWAPSDLADDVLLRAILTVRARAQAQSGPLDAEHDMERFASAGARIGARCVREVYAARGEPVPEDLVALLAGDSDQCVATDRALYVSTREKLRGRLHVPSLEEFERQSREWVPVSEVLQVLVDSMPDWLQPQVIDELRQIAGGRSIEVLVWGEENGQFPSGPTRRALEMAWRYVGAFPYRPGDYDRPLALPESVCRLLLENPREGEAFWAYDCSACGYELPIQWLERDQEMRPVNFLPCPLCGGRVGYSVWSDHHKKAVSR